MPDRVLAAARAGDDKLVELLKAISAGTEPPPTELEWASLRDFWLGKLGRRRRGQHKSTTRRFQAADRRALRISMQFLKIKMRKDPAEREVKRTMRSNGEHYVINERVALCMHNQLKAAGRIAPSVEYLRNVLTRSTATEPDEY